MAERKLTREVPGLEIRASIRPDSVDEERRTLEIVWTTGARVLRGGLLSEPFWEELSLDPAHVRLGRLNGGAPLLNSHNGFELGGVIGVVESAWLDGDEGRATVRFPKAEDDEDADRIFRKAYDGIIRNVSVGYAPIRYKKVDEDERGIPVMRLVDWEPHELSLVPVGADAAAGVRSEGAGKNPCEFVMDDTPQEKRSMSNQSDPQGGAAPAPAPEPATTTEERSAMTEQERRRIEEEAEKRERKRAADIRRTATSLGLGEEFASDHIERGTALDEFRAIAIDERAKQHEQTPAAQVNGHVRVEVGEDLTRKGAQEGLRSALLHRVAPDKFQLDDAGRTYRGMTLMEGARAFLEAHGIRTNGMSKMDVATVALGLGTRAGYHSTSDYPLILADVANKTLRRAYDEAPQTFQAWSRRTTLPDFKPVYRTQLGEAPKLEKVLEGGEFRRGTVGEGREQYQLATYGRVFAVTRQTLINDDMDAFSRVPMLFGRSARDLESDLVYEHFLGNPEMHDGNDLFSGDHDNTGSGAIDIANVGSGRAAMRKQKGLDGKQRINVQARYLMVPAALETTADQFVSTNMLADQFGDINVFAGRLQVISEPRLDDDSEERWYLVADPAQIDTLEYAYLEGEDGPFVEQRVGFDVDGLEIKARHDFAAKVIDWRGFYRSSGT